MVLAACDPGSAGSGPDATSAGGPGAPQGPAAPVAPVTSPSFARSDDRAGTTPGGNPAAESPGGATPDGNESAGDTSGIDDGDPQQAVAATVVHVDDGDSIIVEIDGAEYRVRLIGINTPERDECMAAEARTALIGLVDGETVLLEADVEDRDQFGRLLRYVWLDRTLINAEMARRGFAIARPFEPNTTRQGALETAETAAMGAALGIWDPSACGGAQASGLSIVAVSENPAGRDEDNLNGEFVVIANASDPVDLGGYVLRDGSSTHRFAFPDGFVLDLGAQVVVFVGCGINTETELYWCAAGPVWDNAGDEAFLVTPSGSFAATYSYP